MFWTKPILFLLSPLRIAATNAVDSSHAFYIHPSDYPGMNLVSTISDGKSYGGWRRSVVLTLSAKNKLGFIDGSLAYPNANIIH